MDYFLTLLLSLLAAFQFLFVAIFLFTHKKGNKRNNGILGLIFLLFAISMADYAIRASGISTPAQVLHLIDDGFFFLYGPLIYFYVKGVVYRDFKFKPQDLIHLTPFLVYNAYLIKIFTVTIDQPDQIQFADGISPIDIPVWIYLLAAILFASIFCYLWYSQKTIITYRSVLKDKFSSIDRINLDWLSFIIRSFTAITIVAMIHNMAPVFGNLFFLYASLIILLVFTFLFVNRVLIKALNQPKIFSGIELKEVEKYAGSRLNKVELNNHVSQLIKILETKKLYLNPELTLKDLAAHLQVTPKILSQVINQSFNKKFYDFINTYRCEEVKKILAGPDKKITILEAMYQAGFNSKSSFNKEFKKLTGQTPSEFKRSIPK